MRKVPHNTAVAQLVEQRSPKPKVVGSSPAGCECATVALTVEAGSCDPEVRGSIPTCRKKNSRISSPAILVTAAFRSFRQIDQDSRGLFRGFIYLNIYLWRFGLRYSCIRFLCVSCFGFLEYCIKFYVSLYQVIKKICVML